MSESEASEAGTIKRCCGLSETTYNACGETDESVFPDRKAGRAVWRQLRDNSATHKPQVT